MVIKGAQGREVKEHILPDMVIPKPEKLVAKARKNRALQRKAILEDAWRQFDQAQETVRDLKNELQRQRKARFQEGFDVGRKDGYKAGVNKVEATIHMFGDLCCDLQERQADFMRQSEPFLADFAFRIVEKIVGSAQAAALKPDKAQLMKMVDEVVESFGKAPKIVIRVNQSALGVLEENRTAIATRLPEGMSFSLVADAALKTGDCIIESDFGVLDGCVATKLKQVEKLLGGGG